MKKYVKKPISINAVQICLNNCDIINNIKDYIKQYTKEDIFRINYTTRKFYVKTLEGFMEGNEFDYLIKGIEDEFYICKKDIFEKSYEEIVE